MNSINRIVFYDLTRYFGNLLSYILIYDYTITRIKYHMLFIFFISLIIINIFMPCFKYYNNLYYYLYNIHLLKLSRLLI